jgi:prepilin-type N-terminal cleavage/methylation domain-containing protein
MRRLVRGGRAVIRQSFSLVELMIVTAIVAILSAFVVPSLMQPRMSANESGALGSLRSLASAEAVYVRRYSVYGGLSELSKEGLIDSALAHGEKDGYLFGQIRTNAKSAYCFGAAPVHDGKGDDTEYCVTQRGIFEANFNTIPMSSRNGTHWTPGENQVPTAFTAEPERDRDNWTPLSN